MSITAEQLIKVLLELDQQVISLRPSSWGESAQLVYDLCGHAEPSFRDHKRLGDWNTVDMSSIKRRALRQLEQPILDAILKEGEKAFEAGGQEWADWNMANNPFGD